MNKKPVKNITKKSAKSIETKGLIKYTPLADIFPREIRYLKAKDIKRGMSKVIAAFLKGTLLSDDAKTAAYLFSTYIQILKETEYEARLAEIEKLLENSKKDEEL